MIRAAGLIVVLAAVSRLSAPAAASAVQAAPWLDRGPAGAVSLEFLRPTFNPEGAPQGSTFFLGARLPVGQAMRIVLDVPFTYANHTLNCGDFVCIETEAGSAIGNPYVGIEVGKDGSPLLLEVGARGPLAKAATLDDLGVLAFGMMADVDRIEAFLPDAITLGGNLHYVTRSTSGLGLRLHGGLTGLIPTESGEEVALDDQELLASYGIHAWYGPGSARVGAGFTGRWTVTNEESSFAESSFHQVGLDGEMAFGIVRPGIHLRLPVDKDLSEIVDFVLGLSLRVDIW